MPIEPLDELVPPVVMDVVSGGNAADPNVEERLGKRHRLTEAGPEKAPSVS